jgi:hypothetical protein
MQAELGDLDRVKRRIVKVLGLVNATPDFTRHPFVIDGCSNLFASVFPDLPGPMPAPRWVPARCPTISRLKSRRWFRFETCSAAA